MGNKRCIAVAELAINLARISGSFESPWKCADVASKITSLEITAQHHAERLCNEPLPEGADERKRSSIARRVSLQLGRLGLDGVVNGTIYGSGPRNVPEAGWVAGYLKATPVSIEVGGDPRGCCLKLHHPGLPKNGFGGVGYSVGA